MEMNSAVQGAMNNIFVGLQEYFVLPWTVSVADASALPTIFSATHV